MTLDGEVGRHAVGLVHRAVGVDARRVLFDPQLQPFLYKTSYADYIKMNITIPVKRSWVRHDEHYHVDFQLECKPM